MAMALVGSSGAGLASASSHTSGSGRHQLKLQSVVNAGTRKGRKQRRGLAVSAQSQDGGNDGSFKYVWSRFLSNASSMQWEATKRIPPWLWLRMPYALARSPAKLRQLFRWTVTVK